MKAKIQSKKEISKNNTEYSILIIELTNDKGEHITIQDFGKDIPYEIEEIEVTVKKNEKGFYIIEELDYAIPYKYNLAINLLLRG